MDYIGRIKGLLLTPKDELRRIAGEVEQPMDLFVRWAVPLSAIPVICGFIGVLLVARLFYGVGIGVFGLLVSSIVSYILGLIGVIILAKLFEFLAPKFGGTADPDAAMKMAVYFPTAAWLAGIFALIPRLAFLAILGLYSLYILWCAIPILTRVPEDKRLVFTLALIGCAVVVNLVMMLVVRVLVF